jgi:hypothetical protein
MDVDVIYIMEYAGGRANIIYPLFVLLPAEYKENIEDQCVKNKVYC